MTITNLVRYRCDRCSVDAVQPDDESPPRAWVTITVTDFQDETEVSWECDLCSKCRDSLNAWRYDR